MEPLKTVGDCRKVLDQYKIPHHAMDMNLFDIAHALQKNTSDISRLRSLLGECLDKMYKHSPSCTFSTIPECICENGKLRDKIENELKKE